MLGTIGNKKEQASLVTNSILMFAFQNHELASVFFNNKLASVLFDGVLKPMHQPNSDLVSLKLQKQRKR